jgi:hypothetical protein
MNLVFLLMYQEVLKLPPSPRWSTLQGIPRKGQAPSQVTPWIASDLPHAQVGLWCAFRQASHGPLPSLCRLHYQASSGTTAGLVLFDTQWWPHHKHSWCGLARLQAPLSISTVRASTLGLGICKPH